LGVISDEVDQERLTANNRENEVRGEAIRNELSEIQHEWDLLVDRFVEKNHASIYFVYRRVADKGLLIKMKCKALRKVILKIANKSIIDKRQSWVRGESTKCLDFLSVLWYEEFLCGVDDECRTKISDIEERWKNRRLEIFDSIMRRLGSYPHLYEIFSKSLTPDAIRNFSFDSSDELRMTTDMVLLHNLLNRLDYAHFLCHFYSFLDEE
jgi:hypothetical protein